MNIILTQTAFNTDVLFGAPVLTKASDDCMQLVSNLARYLNGNLSTSLMIALDTFVNELQDSGIWDKITKLYIPSLGYVDGASYNSKDLLIDIRQSWGNATPMYGALGTSSYSNKWTQAKGGLQSLANNTFDYWDAGIILEKLSYTNNDLHILLYKIMGTCSYNDNNRNRFLFCKTNNTNVVTVKQGNGYIYTYNNGVTGNQIPLGLSEEGVLLGVDIDDCKMYTVADTISGAMPITEATINNALTIGPKDVGLTYGLISYGKGLTLEQVSTYRQAVKTLMLKLI